MNNTNTDLNLNKIVNGNEDWIFDIKIMDIENDQYFTLSADNILKVSIVNSMTSLYPVVEIKCVDPGFILQSSIKQNSAIISVSLKRNTSNDNVIKSLDDNNKVQHVFLLDEIKTLSKDVNQCMVLITGIGHLISKCCDNILYYTDKRKSKKSPLKILSEILSTIDISIKNNYIDSTNLIDFTNSFAFTIKDNSKYLLSSALGINDSYSPTYLCYSIHLDGMIFWSNKNSLDQFSNRMNMLQLYSDCSQEENIDILNISEPVLSSPFGGVKSLYYNSDSRYFVYDQINRQWNVDVYNYDNIFKDLSEKLDDRSESELINDKFSKEKFITKLQYYSPDNNRQEVYEYITNMELNSYNISFTVQGHGSRDIGQFCNIQVGNPNLSKSMGGVWVIKRIEHIWEDKIYFQNITAFRTVKLDINSTNIKNKELFR